MWGGGGGEGGREGGREGEGEGEERTWGRTGNEGRIRGSNYGVISSISTLQVATTCI